ncbi:Protein kinase-like domain [Pseudocohnilembus persalinus]|uniref:Protein kinase-like domain n=1 Tax=Pseudocohnilembus persalinus TaxID=266149 RepID=A0A0V0R532_PSEPJ|nr:Protein kinase-like domain [Pseudocohnilembus persalinus]|eukprot:KRX09590.1 Protein kinase-like domain [Pseudocohnilembus persalinus]
MYEKDGHRKRCTSNHHRVKTAQNLGKINDNSEILSQQNLNQSVMEQSINQNQDSIQKQDQQILLQQQQQNGSNVNLKLCSSINQSQQSVVNQNNVTLVNIDDKKYQEENQVDVVLLTQEQKLEKELMQHFKEFIELFTGNKLVQKRSKNIIDGKNIQMIKQFKELSLYLEKSNPQNNLKLNKDYKPLQYELMIELGKTMLNIFKKEIILINNDYILELMAQLEVIQYPEQFFKIELNLNPKQQADELVIFGLNQESEEQIKIDLTDEIEIIDNFSEFYGIKTVYLQDFNNYMIVQDKKGQFFQMVQQKLDLSGDAEYNFKSLFRNKNSRFLVTNYLNQKRRNIQNIQKGIEGKIYQVDKNFVYFPFEYGDYSLQDLFDNEQEFSQNEIIQILYLLLFTINKIHKNRIAIRNLVPENIRYFKNEKTWKICNFSQAVYLPHQESSSLHQSSNFKAQMQTKKSEEIEINKNNTNNINIPNNTRNKDQFQEKKVQQQNLQQVQNKQQKSQQYEQTQQNQQLQQEQEQNQQQQEYNYVGALYYSSPEIVDLFNEQIDYGIYSPQAQDFFSLGMIIMRLFNKGKKAEKKSLKSAIIKSKLQKNQSEFQIFEYVGLLLEENQQQRVKNAVFLLNQLAEKFQENTVNFQEFQEFQVAQAAEMQFEEGIEKTLQQKINRIFRDLKGAESVPTGFGNQFVGESQALQRKLEAKKVFLIQEEKMKARVNKQMRRFVQSVFYYQNVKNLLDNDDWQGSLYYELAELNFENGQYYNSIDFCKIVMETLQTKFDGSFGYTKGQELMGMNYYKVQEIDSAQNYYTFEKGMDLIQNSLIQREKVLKKNHIYLAQSYEDLGYLQDNFGRYKQAYGSFKVALKVYQYNTGYETKDAARLMNLIGMCSWRSGMQQEAYQYLKRACELSEKLYGQFSSQLVTNLVNLGNIMESLKNFQEAVQIQTRACELQKVIFGENSLQYARVLQCNIFTLMYMKEFEKAEEQFKKMEEILKQIYGENSKEMAVLYFNMSWGAEEAGSFKKAFELCQKAIIIMEKIDGVKANRWMQRLEDISVKCR